MKRALEQRGPAWFIAPSLAGHAFGAAVALAAVGLCVELPDRSLAGFLAAAVAGVGAASVVAALIAQGALGRYARAAAGDTRDEAELLAAFAQVRDFPRFVVVLGFGCWAVVAAALCAYGRQALALEWDDVRRLALLGLVFGTLSSAFIFFPVTRRCREALEVLAGELPLQKVIDTARGGRQRLRALVVGFTLAMVLLPSALLFDLVRTDAWFAAAEVGAARPGVERDTVALELRRKVAGRAVGVTALVVLFALIIAREAGRTLMQPLRRVADEAHRLSRGELGPPRFIAAEAEVWAVTSGFTLMQARMFDAVRQLQNAGTRINATTDRLLGTSARYEAGASQQAASLNETSATTEELAQSAKQISHNAQAVSEIAEKTLGAVQAGQQAAEDFARAVERMKQDNRAITDAVVRLQKRVQQIGRIVEFINTVADRSDLLALSAELEGTKAGEVGRGFTLVASEMRRLAENVIESTKEIEELISEIRDATQATVSATEVGLARTEGGMALAEGVARSLAAVVDMARRTSEAVRAITLATQQQQTGTDQLAEAMADILGVTQQGLSATRQLAAANQDLMGLARDLDGLVGHFKVVERP